MNKTFNKTDKIGKYELGQILGRGGFGEVYLGHHPQLNIPVAIKILKPRTKDDDFEKRFIQEARTAAKVNHPNIVRIFDFKKSEEDNIWYLVMEYVAGGTLMDRLKKQPRGLPISDVLNYMIDVVAGMVEAERYSIIHRDLKPDNIMLTKDGQAKITDLGLAKELGDNGHSITREGLTIGSAEYISPEQAMNAKNVDIRADIYSLGITMYQLLTGKLPFTGNSCYEVINKQIKEPLPDPRTLNSMLDEKTVAVINKMCDKMPEMRYQSMTELYEDLRALKNNEPKENLHATVLSRSLAGLAAVSIQEHKPDVSEVEPAMETTAMNAETLFMNTDDDHTVSVDSHPKWTYAGIAILAILIVILTVFITAKLWPKTDVTVESTTSEKIIPAGLKEKPIVEKAPVINHHSQILSADAQPKAKTSFLIPEYSMTFLPISSGEFTMGSLTSEEGRDKDEVQHVVKISHDYWMAQTELTIQQLYKIEQALGKDHRKAFHSQNLDPNSKLPVSISSKIWALDLCRRINKREEEAGRLPPGYQYRLPTEAEWEYACRGGTQTTHFFNYDKNLSDYAWIGTSKKHPVAEKQSNPYGLYDMYGNVSELVFDSYANYPTTMQKDPFVLNDDIIRQALVRGGSSYDPVTKLRSASRDTREFRMESNSSDIGVRLVLAPSQSKEILKRVYQRMEFMRHKDGDRRPGPGFHRRSGFRTD